MTPSFQAKEQIDFNFPLKASECNSNPIPPIPGLKLSNKVDKSRAMPHPRMAADKCIAKDKPGC